MFRRVRVRPLTFEEVQERCLRDVQLTLEIDEKLGISDSCIARPSFSHTMPNDAIYAGSCVDGRQLRAARDLGYVLETKPKHVKEHSGALVLQHPKPFILYKDIAVFDFSSLYPSIIISKRISPDKNRILFPMILSSLKTLRLEWKAKAQAIKAKENYEKTMQEAYKVVLNATYGYLSKRVYRYNLGEEVATTGRQILTHIMNTIMKSYDLKTVYGDTDSLFIEFPSFTEEKALDIEEAISGEVKDHFSIDVDSECDKLFSKLYFPKIAAGERSAKKKYAGKVSWRRGTGLVNPPELEIVGLEAIRSGTPEVFRGLQRSSEVFRGLQRSTNTLLGLMFNETSVETVTSIVVLFKKALFSGDIHPLDLTISRTIAQKSYNVKPFHIQAAEKYPNYRYKDKVIYLHTTKHSVISVINDTKYLSNRLHALEENRLTHNRKDYRHLTYSC